MSMRRRALSLFEKTGAVIVEPREMEPEELTKWQATGRTHEECDGCKKVYVMPPLCGGHMSGPTHCHQFKAKKL